MTTETRLEARSPQWLEAKVDADLAHREMKDQEGRVAGMARANEIHADELKQKQRQQARERGASDVTEGSSGTISDRVREVIDEAAVQASTRPLLENWGRNQSREEIISKIRAELWRTRDGQALRDLDRAVGSKPYSHRAIATIRKSKDAARFDVALDVLDRGIRLPG